MQLKQTEFMGRLGKTMSGIGRHAVSVPAIVLLTCAATLPKAVEAATVDIFLIAEQTAPSSAAGAPFSVSTNTVYQLGGLNSNFRATTATLVNNFTFNVDTALSFASLNDPATGPSSGAPNDPWLTDQGEIGAGTMPYTNSEISSWDNVGISGGSITPNEQLDFGRGSQVLFNPVAGGFTDFLLADLGGLNPFVLNFCPDAACSAVESVFAGFNRSVTNFLLGLDSFAASDTGIESEMDQTWLFRFSNSISDYVQVVEEDDRLIYTGARLQADFIGVGGTVLPSTVPVPPGLPLLASGLGLLVWARRRRKA